MKNQQGSTLVTALIILTVITLVAVYSLETSNIQGRMVSNSLLSSLTYQECKNEYEANIHYYNIDGGAKRDELLQIQAADPDNSSTQSASDTLKTQSESDMSIEWSYLYESPAGKSGVEVDIQSPIRVYQYENDCIAQFRFAQSDQTLGALVEGLKSAGNIK